MTPLVSIIIRCYNEEKHIGRLLSGICQQTIHEKEIILVDSGSTDATISIASRYPVRIIPLNKEDFSFGHSLNVGCSAALGEILVFVSAHVYPVHHDWLEKLLLPFSDDRVASSYGKQRGDTRTSYSEHRIFCRWFPEESDWNQAHPFCNNANAAIRRSLWERFQYNESLTGLEDLDWARQAIGAGYKIAYEAGAEIIHVHEESSKALFNRYRRESIAIKSIFPHEHFGFRNFLWMYLRNVLSDCYLALNQGLLRKHFGNILSFRFMQFWGTYRGFAQHGEITKKLKKKFYYPDDQAGSGNGTFTNDKSRQRIDYASLEKEWK